MQVIVTQTGQIGTTAILRSDCTASSLCVLPKVCGDTHRKVLSPADLSSNRRFAFGTRVEQSSRSLERVQLSRLHSSYLDDWNSSSGYCCLSIFLSIHLFVFIFNQPDLWPLTPCTRCVLDSFSLWDPGGCASVDIPLAQQFVKQSYRQPVWH